MNEPHTQVAKYVGVGNSFSMRLYISNFDNTAKLIIENDADGFTSDGFSTELEARKAFADNIADDLAQAKEQTSVIQGVVLQGTDSTLPLAQRVRQIADMDHPWIPGSQADLIREIAVELESRA